MEFKVNSKELEKLLNKIIPAVPTRTPMPILENFLFEIKNGILTIYATDLEISLKSSINIVADENLSLVVPARLLYDIIKSFPDTTVKFITSNSKINIITDFGTYTLGYIEANEYPEIPSFPEKTEEDLQEISINGLELKKAFDKTSFAMGKEEMRPAMMGTLLELSEEGLRFVATDGHRLVNLLNKKITSESLSQYIIPEKAISVLQKILDEKDVKLYLSKTHISFKLSDIELITRLIGQKYPDFKAVIPLENEFSLQVKTKELHDAIKRMLLFATTNTKRVKFSITADKIEISAEDIDLGSSAKESVISQYNGEPLDIGFNAGYVNDILSHMSNEKEVIFKLNSPTKAAIVIPGEEKESEELMMLLMPVRLNS
jgi:DNA polymerase-3 subunit beta